MKNFDRYISGRGATQRVTLPIVGQKESSIDAQRKITPIRSRKTGLHTVTERPPGNFIFFLTLCKRKNLKKWTRCIWCITLFLSLKGKVMSFSLLLVSPLGSLLFVINFYLFKFA